MTEPPSRIRAVAAWLWRPLLVLLVVAVAAWVVLGLGPLYESDDDGADEPESAPSRSRPAPPPRPGVRPRPKPTTVPAGCTPEHERVCLQGDAWWLDSCGNPHALAEDCDRVPCEDGACEVPDPQCADGPTAWACDGDVARGCNASQAFAIDCAAEGKRCVMTEEGPICRTPGEDDCDEPSGTTRCEDNTLVACVDGRSTRFDCTTVGGLCLPGRGGRGFRCVRVAPASSDEGCGPCGCPPRFDVEEQCNGRDDDGDGFIDEGVDCGVVDIVAFVPTDAGDAAYSQDDIELEVERINDFFSRDDEYGLQFQLAEVIALDRSDWLEIDDEDTQDLLATNVLVLDREEFYVPIVFTDELLYEDVPRPGLATPPNGICGGQRRVRSPQPGLGGIVIAKRRWMTTVAHEVGHFLGLCHTHMPAVDTVETYEGEGDPQDAKACDEPCAWEGDGICDTPEDPGPPQCVADPTCSVVCETDASPSAENLMGYYPSCRSAFTEQQALEMRHGLWLRRGWHRCLRAAGCGCEPAVGDCPEGMSCRQYQRADEIVWRCGLDGAVVPGGPCRSSNECSKGSTCVEAADGQARCTRPCKLGTELCDCRLLAGVQYPLCVEDLLGATQP